MWNHLKEAFNYGLQVIRQLPIGIVASRSIVAQYCLFSILCVFIFPSYAQNNLSNLRHIQVSTAIDTVLLDSLPVFPHTTRIYTIPDKIRSEDDAFSILYNQLIWKEKPLSDSVSVYFRVMSADWKQALLHKDSAKIAPSENTDYIGFDYKPYARPEQIIRFEGLNYNGSFARGISFGNSQSLVLNSNFNLQLSGDLGDDIKLLAAISDNNIPLQPEGNTQQLQEFDKIFVQIQRKNNNLIAGDYELYRPEGYFVNYLKKLQGATFTNTTTLSNEAILQSRGSFAISRGNFARNTVETQEGNQGPYKLRGAEGEVFIIVLSGTEKIYWDGQLLQRGLEYDYIIDYNRGEITFTNRRMVTKDIRVIAEFEYSVQQYLRSMWAVNSEYQQDKLKLYFNAYSEQDNKTSGQTRDLTTAQRQAISDAGDNVDDLLAPGERPADENSSPIQYIKVINTKKCANEPDTIFRRALPGDSGPLYAVSFTQVNQGNGTYIRPPAAADGTVFEYIAPDDMCQLQGNYVPLVKLLSPKKQQLVSAGAQYDISKNSQLKSEIAISNFDRNRFSRRDKGDDYGAAFFTSYTHHHAFNQKENGWKLQSDVRYEFVQSQFAALKPFRNAEFTRDWNINSGNDIQSDEHLARAGFLLSRTDQHKNAATEIGYHLSGFWRDTVFNGINHEYVAGWKSVKGFSARAWGSVLRSEGIQQQSSFVRPKAEIAHTFHKWNNWKISLYGEQEKNSRKDIFADSLLSSSFHYDLGRVTVSSPDTGNIQWRTAYTIRRDRLPKNGRFTDAAQAQEINIQGAWTQSRASQLNWNFTWRTLNVDDTALVRETPQNGYLGGLDHRLNLFRGMIRSSTAYQIGSGQEQKIEFIYKPIQPGEQGTHIWRDINNDSIIQYDEVDISPFPDAANLLRLTQFTNEFIRTNNVQLNQSIALEPRILWDSKKGLRKLISKFGIQSAIRIQRKVRQNPTVAAWNPFQLDVSDTSLISIASGINTILHFNRANPKFDIQLTLNTNRNRTILTTGFESNSIRQQSIRGRFNFRKQLSLVIETGIGNRFQDSEIFNSRDYDITFNTISPELIWQPNTKFRSGLSYAYEKQKNNLPESGEILQQQAINIESTLNTSSATSLTLGGSFVIANFTGQLNTPVAFTMLNGLQNGNNLLWNVSLDRRLANNLQINFGYDGRKTGNGRVVHVGRAQVRVVF